MRADVSVDVKAVTRLAKRFPTATADQIEEYTERVGRKLEREAKYAMRKDVAGANQARSREGNLVDHIFFHPGGKLGGVVKAHANYSKYVHGPPFHPLIAKKNGGFRKTNPFFTTALDTSARFIEQENRNFVRKLKKRL